MITFIQVVAGTVTVVIGLILVAGLLFSGR